MWIAAGAVGVGEVIQEELEDRDEQEEKWCLENPSAVRERGTQEG